MPSLSAVGISGAHAGEDVKPVASKPAEFAQFLKTEQARWKEVAKANGINLN